MGYDLQLGPFWYNGLPIIICGYPKFVLCEVWGVTNTDIIERLHLKLKFKLDCGMKTNTPNEYVMPNYADIQCILIEGLNADWMFIDRFDELAVNIYQICVFLHDSNVRGKYEWQNERKWCSC